MPRDFSRQDALAAPNKGGRKCKKEYDFEGLKDAIALSLAEEKKNQREFEELGLPRDRTSILLDKIRDNILEETRSEIATQQRVRASAWQETRMSSLR